ncbi:hypothetical protein K9L27_03515 [Candidatus Gracilibacteria bacterium]|nr:hypothetical protein [Candidatus Gracilibacteria bacterium]
MVKFHFGLGGDDDASNNEDKKTQEVLTENDASTGGSDDGQTPAVGGGASSNTGSTAGNDDDASSVTIEEGQSSEPVIEKIQEPSHENVVPPQEKESPTSPFPPSFETKNKENFSTGNGSLTAQAVVIPAATPITPTKNPFQEGAQTSKGIKDHTPPAVPNPVFPQEYFEPSLEKSEIKIEKNDVFSPVAEGTIIPKTNSSSGIPSQITPPGLDPITPPLVEKEKNPVIPIVKKEEISIPVISKEKTNPMSGSGNRSSHDPAQTLKQVKFEIESYVKIHKDKIKQYQDQIGDLNEKIKQEKIALRQKHDEFADLLKEMNELTKDFDGNGGGNNSAPQKPYRPQHQR